MIRFIPTPFPVAARRTGRADFPHPALSGIMPSHTEGRPFSPTGSQAPVVSPELIGGCGASPARPSCVAGATTSGADDKVSPPPPVRRATSISTSSFAFTCSALRSSSTVSGVARLIRQSPRARSCQHYSQTRGPFLLRHYPVSAVLRPHPPPRRAGSAPHSATVGQRRSPATQRGFPCCTRSLFRTCRRHYPGGTVGCPCRSPSPTAAAFPEYQAGRLPHCPFRGLLSVHCSLRPVRSLSPYGPFSIRSFNRFVTSAAVPIATGWNDICRVGFAPTGTVHLCTAH